MEKITYKSIDQYIASQSESVRPLLEQLRKIILAATPALQEVISYGMPAFKSSEVLVYFAANKNHIGFYPTGSPIIYFNEQLRAYKTSKGAIQFPLDKPLPEDLIVEIVKYRATQAAEKLAQKRAKKTAKK